MGTPLTADQLVSALCAEGVSVTEHPGWRTRNRNHKGPWGPVHGVMVHHTVTSGTASSVALCRDGHATLPGPLCHGVIDKTGRVHLIGHGRANHAGAGDDDVLAAVVAERSPLPGDNETSTDGNRHFYGFEAINLGDNEDPWPEAQVEAIARAAAGICRTHGWGAESVIGHSEWQPGKVDPRGPIGTKNGPALTMNKIRARVAQLLDDDKPTTPAPAKPKPKPSGKVVDLSRLIATARRDPAASGAPVSYAGARIVEDALAAEGLLAKKYADGHFGTATVTAYAKWQRRCGYSGGAADGIPGRASLDTLARRHGFKVAA
ncbi:N-acetylmuramoyl-L-alanine amidase [Streptomyces sp. TRM66268-LWL]|uniref:N-acetylmuramoyl-L-alanine amidase n=1 Tax=Streptomyces polyasparticus TaxID=2767826 RepID=A0ABR7SH77_9ACTN|nr:N-acetylmuramoyl-L-alanine amidase [Streptomyces polyasparticus]MBC9714085.1 N-acetylmuramoyl-L-alanine amidase [Streptomyces polyasparticus]